MSIESVVLQRQVFLRTLGKRGLTVKYPNEFEFYLCAFELTDQNYNTLEYFVFPVMPSSIDENQPQMNNVKKTMGGVINLSSGTYIPADITISGNFGRSFKVLVGENLLDLVYSFIDKIEKDNPFKIHGEGEVFSENTKTGYGCIKILERIINTSRGYLSDGSPTNLIFYNLALGNSYFVKPMNLRFSQDESTNMIWNYNLQMKTLGRIDDYVDRNRNLKSNSQLINDEFNRRRVNKVYNTISGFLDPQYRTLGGFRGITSTFEYDAQKIEKALSLSPFKKR